MDVSRSMVLGSAGFMMLRTRGREREREIDSNAKQAHRQLSLTKQLLGKEDPQRALPVPAVAEVDAASDA